MTFAHTRHAPIADDLAVPSIQIDHLGLIRILPKQFHSRDELVAHFITLKDTIASVKARYGYVRVLVDLRGSAVLDPEGGKVVQEQIATLYGPQDRLALIVASQLVRMQSRRLLGAAIVRQFDSALDAERWLSEPQESVT